jgi:FkbM family methyltransferase
MFTLKRVIKALLSSLASLVYVFLSSNKLGRYVRDRFVERTVRSTCQVYHKKTALSFYVNNSLSEFRVETFSTKEPETLDWIDSFRPNSVFWDIGANVGLYTIYAAKTTNAKVFAFEPSVYNLESLVSNIILNEQFERIVIVPLPLADRNQISDFFVSSTAWAGALAHFGSPSPTFYRPEGFIHSFKLPGMSLEGFAHIFDADLPDYIKIDVDGIEHIILKGAGSILQSAREVLVEVNSKNEEQVYAISNLMKKNGFELKQDFLAPESEVRNELWVRRVG